jgi:alpha-L-arabinofuranosidase
VNPTSQNTEVDLNLAGVAGLNSATAVVLQGNPEDENSIDKSRKVAPVTTSIDVTQPRFRHTFPRYSLSVLRFDVTDD